MNGKTSGVHWSFWVISAVALIWHVMGSMNYLWQMSPEAVAAMPETHRAIIIGRPVWATGGFAIGVFGGAIASLLLLFRKSAAIYLFIASILGVIVTMIHTVSVASSKIEFTLIEIVVMILMPIAVGALLIWYSRQARSKGWIN